MKINRFNVFAIVGVAIVAATFVSAMGMEKKPKTLDERKKELKNKINKNKLDTDLLTETEMIKSTYFLDITEKKVAQLIEQKDKKVFVKNNSEKPKCLDTKLYKEVKNKMLKNKYQIKEISTETENYHLVAKPIGNKKAPAIVVDIPLSGLYKNDSNLLPTEKELLNILSKNGVPVDKSLLKTEILLNKQNLTMHTLVFTCLGIGASAASFILFITSLLILVHMIVQIVVATHIFEAITKNTLFMNILNKLGIDAPKAAALVTNIETKMRENKWTNWLQKDNKTLLTLFVLESLLWLFLVIEATNLFVAGLALQD